MQVSRSESHQQDKRKRKKRLRRLLIVNVTLFSAIIVLIGVWFVASGSGGLSDWLNEVGSSETAANTQQTPNNAKSGGNDPSVDEADSSDAEGKDGNAAAEEVNGSNNDAGNASNSGNDVNGTTDDAAVNGTEAGTGGSGADTVSLSFVGDLLLGEYVDTVMKREGYDFLYKQSLLYLSEPDLTAGNLEHPVTNRGVPAEDKEYVYKGSPEALPALRDAGFDVMTLANNHTLDQGVEGLLDTMSYLEEVGIHHVGAGNNDTEAFAPVIKEVRGIKVAYIGLSRVVPLVSWKADKNVAGVAETYETKRAVAAIAKAKEQADIVVVMVHWGDERVDQPVAYQKDFGRQYIDAGADLVIGSHPHVLQGFEMYKGKWIAYSLGNFIFSAFPKGTEGETGVLDAVCTKSGDCDMTFHPMFTVNAQPTPLEGDAALALLDRLSSISFGVKLNENGSLVPE